MFSPKLEKIAYRGKMRVRFDKPLSEGNSKLSRDVLIFNLLAVYTCPNCRHCKDDCYALKAQRQYPDVWNKRLYFSRLAVRHPAFLKVSIRDQLNRTTKKIVRIHESGDFVSQEYLDMWVSLAKEFPQIKFYSYTKTRQIFDFSKADELENLNIIDSFLPDGCVNFGDTNYCKDKLKKYPTIKICPVTRGWKNLKCMKDCKDCLTERRMMFIQH